MDSGALFRRTAATVNRAVTPLLGTQLGKRVLGGSFAVLTYRGRKSGREITVPVNYRRDKASGDVVVHVMAPDAKTWWRNFTGQGGPVTVRLGEAEHQGTAVATRNAKGGVAVRITLA